MIYSNHGRDIIRTHYPHAKEVFSDNFSDTGLSGWSYHDQYNHGFKRYTPQLSRISQKTRSMVLRTPHIADAECWARKTPGGIVMPDKIEKIIFGCDFTWRSWGSKGLYALNFGIDTQRGTSQREWYRIRYLRSANGTSLDNKIQYSTTGLDNPIWADVLDLNSNPVVMDLCWNEPYKPMWSSIVIVIDVLRYQYDRLWINYNHTEMLSDLDVGTVLSEFNNGLVNMYFCKNKPDSAGQAAMYFENPFLFLTLRP